MEKEEESPHSGSIIVWNDPDPQPNTSHFKIIFSSVCVNESSEGEIENKQKEWWVCVCLWVFVYIKTTLLTIQHCFKWLVADSSAMTRHWIIFSCCFCFCTMCGLSMIICEKIYVTSRTSQKLTHCKEKLRKENWITQRGEMCSACFTSRMCTHHFCCCCYKWTEKILPLPQSR